MRHHATFGLVAGVLLCVAGSGVGQESTPTPVTGPAASEEIPLEVVSDEEAADLPTFRGEVDVSLIGLYVSVVDGKRRPVSGLTKDDFEVTENGRPVEITNFEAVSQQELQPLDQADTEDDAEAPDGRYVVLLFDNPSLERKARKRVVKELGAFIKDGLQQNDRFMIALNSGELEIVKPFTANESGLLAALEVVADGPSGGDSLKKRKRYLKRTVYATDIYDNPVLPETADPATSASAVMTANRLLTEIENVRRLEYNRINRALMVTDELLRSLAGLNGRKAVIWIGEDLALQPAYDIYAVWYSRAVPLRTLMTVDHPEIWAQALMLDRQFLTVAANAQAAGATIYMVDASDRDREMANADFSPSSATSVLISESTGTTWTPGTDFRTVHQRTEGGHLMAVATGGDAFGNTRNIPSIIDSLAEHVSTYYYLGYRRSGPPDGKRHDVNVKARGENLHVRHHEQVLDKTVPQKLADLAMSRLRLDLGDNDLQLALELDDPEPLGDESFVLPIHLTIPVERLVLLPDAGQHIGQILVAVAVLDDKGQTAPVHLMRLRLSIPSERYREGAIASQPIRLKLADGTQRIAVSVRDEVSGAESSLALPVADLPL